MPLFSLQNIDATPSTDLPAAVAAAAKNVIFALVTCTLLTGCDAANDLATKIVNEDQETMTLVIKSGYMAQVGGEAVPIFGTDECPANDSSVKPLFGPEPGEGQRACVVIAPETKAVNVQVGRGERAEHEVWTVERDGNRTMLRRADGSYVSGAK